MIRRIAALTAAATTGIALSALVPEVPSSVREMAGLTAPSVSAAESEKNGGHAHEAESDGHGHTHGEGEEGEENPLHLTDEQIEAAGITVAAAAGGAIARLIAVPGTLTANADRLVHVPAKVAGTIAEVRKKLGDAVAAGEVLAVIESREIAEAKSEFLAAVRAEQLARTIFERESGLWKKRITAEQDFLKARADAEDARIKLDLARQKLSALGLGEKEVAALAKGGTEAGSLRLREVRSPLAGRVIERQAALGAPVGADADLFVVADLSTVWVEMAVPPADLPFVKEGQTVTVTGAGGEAAEGKVVFLSPVIDPDTRSTRAVALLDNPDQRWRPGSFVTAAVAADPQTVDLLVSRDAVQAIDGEQVVFVRTAEGFEKREVVLGRANERVVEVVFGLDLGERIAVANTFTLKAQLGKAEAEHSHSH